MSIETSLISLQNEIASARNAIVTKGGTVTSGGGSSQLATDILSINSIGSLIDATCSSNITSVLAKFTYQGSQKTIPATINSNNNAYMIIPYGFSGEVTVEGYKTGLINPVVTVSVTISSSTICEYKQCNLVYTDDAIVYNAGTWTGVGDHVWRKITGYASNLVDATNEVEAESDKLTIIPQEGYNTPGQYNILWLDYKLSNRGYSKIYVDSQYTEANSENSFGYSLIRPSSLTGVSNYIRNYAHIPASVRSITSIDILNEDLGQQIYLAFFPSAYVYGGSRNYVYQISFE